MCRIAASPRYIRNGLSPELWLTRVTQPIDLHGQASKQLIRRDGNPDGELFGQILVFTGSLSIRRREAADAAAAAGCRVDGSVTQHTNACWPREKFKTHKSRAAYFQGSTDSHSRRKRFYADCFET